MLEQGSKCKLCSITFSKKAYPQFDHIDGDHTNNATENCQAICANCHDAKSREENVKRSHQKKDIDFVKHCPLCNHKTRWSDYDLSKIEMSDQDRTLIKNSEYMLADQGFFCAGCQSLLKVIRVDVKNPKKWNTKKHEEVVKYCTSCGCEYGGELPSNKNIICHNCNTKFSVWIKEYKKKSGWFS